MGFGFVLFDVTDETTISHFFALRYRADTLCKSPELVGKGFSPNLFFVSLYEMAVLLGFTGDGVSDGVCLRYCDIIFRVGVLF